MVNSRSGVGFLVMSAMIVEDSNEVVVVVDVVIAVVASARQANLGRGKFITGTFETILNRDANTLLRSASLDDDTSLEL